MTRSDDDRVEEATRLLDTVRDDWMGREGIRGVMVALGRGPEGTTSDVVIRVLLDRRRAEEANEVAQALPARLGDVRVECAWADPRPEGAGG
jgi:hypothetical protein